jgi:hypothetical protein
MSVNGDSIDGHYPMTYEAITGSTSVGLLQVVESGSSSGSEEPVHEEPVPLGSGCDPSYPDLCLAPGSADLHCDSIYGLSLSHITVYPPDPHRLDGHGDGIGCEG